MTFNESFITDDRGIDILDSPIFGILSSVYFIGQRDFPDLTDFVNQRTEDDLNELFASRYTMVSRSLHTVQKLLKW